MKLLIIILLLLSVISHSQEYDRSVNYGLNQVSRENKADTTWGIVSRVGETLPCYRIDSIIWFKCCETCPMKYQKCSTKKFIGYFSPRGHRLYIDKETTHIFIKGDKII